MFQGEGLSVLREGLPNWYVQHVGQDGVQPKKLEKLHHRLDSCNCVIGIGMVPDVNGRISPSDEEWAVACAVQNMHLTAAAFGLGAFWSTNVAAISTQMRDFIGLGPRDRAMGLFYVGYPACDWPEGSRGPVDAKVTWHRD